MKILECHEIPKDIDLDDYNLEDYDVFTFDDGLYSQYLNVEKFLKYNKPMYFFISTGIVHSNNSEQIEFVNCLTAHNNFFKNKDTRPYMTWEQIKELSKLKNVFIGGHTHFHPFLEKFHEVKRMKIALKEIELMLKTFSEHNLEISSFCFPYNFDYFLYRKILKNFKFFGPGRIPIFKENYNEKILSYYDFQKP